MMAFLTLKPFAYVVTDMAGAAVSIAEDELVAGVRFFTTEPVDAKVIRIGKTAPVPCVCDPVLPHFIRDSGRILAQIFGNLPERLSIVERLFNE